MASGVVWLEQARRDLERILSGIAEVSPAAEKKYRAGIIKACRKLTDFPRSGRRYNEVFRAIVYRNHVLYQVSGATDDVEIVLVIDARRDVDGVILDLLT